MKSKPSSLYTYTEHDDVWLLLPWYANNSLVGEEHRRVLQHVQACPLCRGELAALQQLGDRWGQETLELKPGENFARLMERIEAEQKPSNAATIRSRAPRWSWRILNHGFSLSSPVKTAGFAVASVVGAILVVLVGRATFWSETVSYRTLGTAGAMDSYGPNDLRIVFAPESSSQQISALIESLNGRIIDGPTSLGAFTVRLRVDDAASANVVRTAQKLRKNPLIVLAEPALPPAPQDREPLK